MFSVLRRLLWSWSWSLFVRVSVSPWGVLLCGSAVSVCCLLLICCHVVYVSIQGCLGWAYWPAVVDCASVSCLLVILVLTLLSVLLPATPDCLPVLHELLGVFLVVPVSVPGYILLPLLWLVLCMMFRFVQ